MRENRQTSRDRLLDRVEEGVLTVDEAGRCQSCNRQAAELLESPVAELTGEPVAEVFPGAIGDRVERRLETARAADEPVGFRVSITSITVEGRVYASEEGGSVHFEEVGTDSGAFDRPGELLSALIDDSSKVVFLKDTDGVYRFANETTTEIFGQPTVVGKTDAELFDPETAGRIERIDRRVIETGEAETYEVTPEIDGDERVFEVEKHPYVTEDGVVRGVAGIGRERTAQRERERQLERREFLFERVQEIANIGVWELNPAADTVWMSSGAARIYGVDESYQPTVQEAIDFYCPEDRAVVERAVEQALETGEWPGYEGQLVGADGKRRDVRVRGEVITDESGDPELIRGVGQDITEQKSRERALERKNERLDEFASVISHDLRNPLAVAKGNATLLADGHDEAALDGLTDALDRMESIIDDTLQLARQGETVSQPEPVALRPLVEECWGMVETGEASVAVETDATIRGDYDRLRQVFENLFCNAVDHGPADVAVRVGIDGETLYVADDGPGIPPGERADAFDPGYSATDDGTGFGLAIVRRIAEAHGWSVQVVESSRGGARFEFDGVETV